MKSKVNISGYSERSLLSIDDTISYRGSKVMNLKKNELSIVKYKCLVTIVSLLESNYQTTGLSEKIMRALPLSILTDNLRKVYQLYKKVYPTDEYKEEIFNHMEEDY